MCSLQDEQHEPVPTQDQGCQVWFGFLEAKKQIWPFLIGLPRNFWEFIK